MIDKNSDETCDLDILSGMDVDIHDFGDGTVTDSELGYPGCVVYSIGSDGGDKDGCEWVARDGEGDEQNGSFDGLVEESDNASVRK